MHEYIYCSISNLMGRMIIRIYHADVNHKEYAQSRSLGVKSNSVWTCLGPNDSSLSAAQFQIWWVRMMIDDEDWWCFSSSRDWSWWRIYFSGQRFDVADVHVLVDLLLIIMGLVKMTRVFPRGSGQWYWSVGLKALGSKKTCNWYKFLASTTMEVHLHVSMCLYILCVRLF